MCLCMLSAFHMPTYVCKNMLTGVLCRQTNGLAATHSNSTHAVHLIRAVNNVQPEQID